MKKHTHADDTEVNICAKLNTILLLDSKYEMQKIS